MKNTTPATKTDADETAPPSRRQAIGLAVMIVAVVVVGVIVLFYAVTTRQAHTAAVEDLHTARASAEFAAADVDARLSDRATAAGTAAAEAQALSSILDLLPADLVDPATARDDAAAATTTLSTAAAAAVPVLDAAAPVLVDVDENTATTAQLTDAADQARQRTGFLVTQRTQVATDTATLVQAVDTARTARTALVAAAIAKSPSITVDRAGDAERAALSAALDALKDVTADTASTDALSVVKAYTDALSATRTAHDAAVAAEQDAQRQASEREQNNTGTRSHSNTGSSGNGGGGSSRSSGGNSGGNPGNGNSGGSAGGGTGGAGSGGGGATESGSGSSGGNSGPAWSPLKVVRGGSACYSSPVSGQQVTYGSTLVVPPDAAGYSTYEVPGYGWGVTWECF